MGCTDKQFLRLSLKRNLLLSSSKWFFGSRESSLCVHLNQTPGVSWEYCSSLVWLGCEPHMQRVRNRKVGVCEWHSYTECKDPRVSFVVARRLAWLSIHGIAACRRIRYLTDLPSARNWVPASCTTCTEQRKRTCTPRMGIQWVGAVVFRLEGLQLLGYWDVQSGGFQLLRCSTSGIFNLWGIQ